MPAILIRCSRSPWRIITCTVTGSRLLLFTENETNCERVFNTPSAGPYVKDGINNYLIHNKTDAVNPDKTGTKASAHYHLSVKPGAVENDHACGSRRKYPVLQKQNPPAKKRSCSARALKKFSARGLRMRMNSMKASPRRRSARMSKRSCARRLRACSGPSSITTLSLTSGLPNIQRTRCMGGRRASRNREWYHMVNDDIISMPDKWEYPWYAAWDLAFHTVALNMVDQDFAKQQLDLMLSEVYLHPSGQIPAYEWNFGDVNPPVHAFATLFNYNIEKQLNHKGDIDYLKNAFQKLLLNFTWWVNRKDENGNNVFSGGFSGS